MKIIKVTCAGNGEMMVLYPNGAIEFHKFWSLMRMAWWAIRNGYTLRIEDKDK